MLKSNIAGMRVSVGYKVEVYTAISDATDESLSKQGVSMDDWDYMLFVETPPNRPVPNGFDNEGPIDSTISRLLTGCCDNRWHLVEFEGRRGFLGVAYHA